MSELPLSSPYRSRPADPVTDAERERVGIRLNEAYAAGTLAEGDFRSRLDTLYAARQLGDLVPVVTGLPPAPTYDQPALVTVGDTGGRPGELSPARTGTGLSAVAVAGVAVAVVLLIVLLVLLL